MGEKQFFFFFFFFNNVQYAFMIYIINDKLVFNYF